MKQTIIALLILGALIAVATGQELENCGGVHCSNSVSLQRLAGNLADEAFFIYPGESRLCDIANYIRRGVQDYYGTGGWVVLIGKGTLLANRIEFATRHNHIYGYYTRFTYKEKHDIEVFRVANYFAEPLNNFTTIVSDKIEPRVIVNIKTNMEPKRANKFKILVNEVFEKQGTLVEAADDILNGIECTGEWVVLTAAHGRFEQFCASSEKYARADFFGSYIRTGSPNPSKDVTIFAPF